jgi:cytoskeletal protein CcmA (bactofilin family)
MDQSMNSGSAPAKNTLAADVEIKGNIKFAGELFLDGRLEGEIVTDGHLIVGENAVITGDIAVNSVLVRGKVTGNVTARDRIEIKSKSELFGDIKAAKLVIEEGVTFVGKTEVNPNKLPLGVAPPLRSQELPRPVELPKALAH